MKNLLLIIAFLICATPVSAQVSSSFTLGTRLQGATLPVSCTDKRRLFTLTQVDGANAAGLYRCNGTIYVAVSDGAGTVTSVSVVSANGLAGSVASATTTPAITLSTTITGVLKGNGTAISAAVAGTDYESPLTFTANDFDRAVNTVSIDYTNGQTASGAAKGFLSAADWTTFNNKQNAITFGTGVQTALGVNIGSAGAPVLFNGALGSPSSVGTIPAFTLGGTISGGGNQLNNVVIGTSSPLAGTFNGIAISPAVSTTGEFRVGATTSGIDIQSGTVNLGSLSNFGWSSGDVYGAAKDTNLSRSSAGLIAFGTGAQGSTAGSWTAANGTLSGTLTFPDDVRQTFNPGATVAGLNVGSQAGDPSTPINGDIWYDSTGNTLDARINGATVSLGGGIGGSTGATDNAILRADGTGGATLQNSSVTISDAGLLTVTADTGINIYSNTISLRGNPVPEIALWDGGQFGWSSTIASTGSSDTRLSRESAGIVRVGTTAANSAGKIKAAAYLTDTNCADSAGAAACGDAAAGHFVIDAASTSTVVSTTKVTPDSEITLTRDDSLGTRLGVTCNTQSSLTLGTPRVTARTAGTSFTVTIELGPTTNPLCVGYKLTN